MRQRASQRWTREGRRVDNIIAVEEPGRMGAGLALCESYVIRVYRGQEECGVGRGNAVAKGCGRGDNGYPSVQTGRNSCTKTGSDLVCRQVTDERTRDPTARCEVGEGGRGRGQGSAGQQRRACEQRKGLHDQIVQRLLQEHSLDPGVNTGTRRSNNVDAAAGVAAVRDKHSRLPSTNRSDAAAAAPPAVSALARSGAGGRNARSVAALSTEALALLGPFGRGSPLCIPASAALPCLGIRLQTNASASKAPCTTSILPTSATAAPWYGRFDLPTLPCPGGPRSEAACLLDLVHLHPSSAGSCDLLQYTRKTNECYRLAASAV